KKKFSAFPPAWLSTSFLSRQPACPSSAVRFPRPHAPEHPRPPADAQPAEHVDGPRSIPAGRSCKPVSRAGSCPAFFRSERRSGLICPTRPLPQDLSPPLLPHFSSPTSSVPPAATAQDPQGGARSRRRKSGRGPAEQGGRAGRAAGRHVVPAPEIVAERSARGEGPAAQRSQQPGRFVRNAGDAVALRQHVPAGASRAAAAQPVLDPDQLHQLLRPEAPVWRGAHQRGHNRLLRGHRYGTAGTGLEIEEERRPRRDGVVYRRRTRAAGDRSTSSPGTAFIRLMERKLPAALRAVLDPLPVPLGDPQLARRLAGRQESVREQREHALPGIPVGKPHVRLLHRRQQHVHDQLAGKAAAGVEAAAARNRNEER
ncbi:MAG: hypothetical protein BJ554DRAFT_6178, partial [Olpidium bornovanus]